MQLSLRYQSLDLACRGLTASVFLRVPMLKQFVHLLDRTQSFFDMPVPTLLWDSGLRCRP